MLLITISQQTDCGGITLIMRNKMTQFEPLSCFCDLDRRKKKKTLRLDALGLGGIL